jgi:hypothetical protein
MIFSAIGWFPLTMAKNQGSMATRLAARRSHCERYDHSLGGFRLDDD